MGDDRAIVYREGPLLIFRVSGLGSCVTALVAASLGHSEARSGFQEGIMGSAAKEGNLHEDVIVQEMRDGKIPGLESLRLLDPPENRVHDGQWVVERKIMRNVWTRGHADGLGMVGRQRNPRLIEIKTMSQNRFRNWTSHATPEAALVSDDFRKYGFQVSEYWYGCEDDRGLPNPSGIIYVVKNRNTGEVLVHEMSGPVVTRKEIRKRVGEVAKWHFKDEVPPCEAYGSEKFFCPFPYLHDSDTPFGTEDDTPHADLSETDRMQIVGLARRHQELSATIRAGKAAEEERKPINKGLLEHMPARAEGQPSSARMAVGGYKMYRKRGVSKRQDLGKLSELLCDGMAEEGKELTDLDWLQEVLKEARYDHEYEYPVVEWVGEE